MKINEKLTKDTMMQNEEKEKKKKISSFQAENAFV